MLAKSTYFSIDMVYTHIQQGKSIHENDYHSVQKHHLKPFKIGGGIAETYFKMLKNICWKNSNGYVFIMYKYNI